MIFVRWQRSTAASTGRRVSWTSGASSVHGFARDDGRRRGVESRSSVVDR
jgi:hypothetical protein